MQVRTALAVSLLALTSLGAGEPHRPEVGVSGGTVEGQAIQGALVFRGIPFAAPPVGELRWRAPQPVVPWQGVRDAKKPAPACLQKSEGWNRANYLYSSENCLTLDIRTPSLAGKRPVMVWIHGGSNRAGSASGPADSDMSDHGVVNVAIQYRLGLLGFFSHPALTKEQGGSSGNYGLMDQIAALKWVRDNIAKFGGDPDNVTIYGESAGSQDVSLMLAAPAAQGLFERAIMQSGTPGFGMAFRRLADAEKIGMKIDKLADAGGDIEKLRALSPVALLDIQHEAGRKSGMPEGENLFLRTTVDGKVLPEAPDRLIAKNAPKPVILGVDKVEFGPPAGFSPLGPFANFWFPGHGAEALAAYKAEANPDPRRGPLALRMQSDAEFHCPTDRLADLLASHGWPVWSYEFDIGENGALTFHSHEIGYVFSRMPVGSGVRMQDYWAALAVTGDPNGKTAISQSRAHWERWDPAHPQAMFFGQDRSGMEPGKPRAEFCKFAEAY